MAPSSPRCLGTSRALPHLARPRTDSQSAGAFNDTMHRSCTGLDSLQSRLEAVDRDTVRRKFALYGREHAHVDHLSGPVHDTSVSLQSSVLLQEDGRLAASLDDVTYVLDGLVGHVKTLSGCAAQTYSVLELVKFLQNSRILQALELSSQKRWIQSKMKEVLLTKLRETNDKAFRLSLAVLVYFVSRLADAEEYITHKVLDAVVDVLKQEVIREEAKDEPTDCQEMKTRMSESTQQIHARTRKCLKRKQSLCQQRLNRMNAVEEKVAGAFPCADRASVVRSTLATPTVQVVDEHYWMKLNELLRDHESFYVEGKLHVSVVSVLSAALRILLQVSDFPSKLSSDLAQRGVSAQSDDAAEGVFRLIRARKCQLVRNGGIDVLVRVLSQKLNGLETLLSLISAKTITLECAHLLNSVIMLLGAFDQVTFLTLDVQRYISKKKDFFAMLLKLIQLLSELSWGIHAQKRWEAELTRMSLAVEVLLSALRVLINLTHHNLEAASHVFALGGMQLLLASLFQLRGLTAIVEKPSVPSSVTSKWEFDACLLYLSVMINSIEFSEENRDALASASVCQDESACDALDLFTRFFLEKLESYKHLIDLAETQGVRGAISIEDIGDDWSPEDVILGGCTSLLLGYLIQGSPANRTTILNSMPECSPRLLLRALSVFAAFHSQLDALTPEVAKSVLHVEKVLKSCQGNECDAQRGLLTCVAAKAYPGVSEWQYVSPMPSDFVSAAKSEVAGINLSSALVKSVECKSSDTLSSSLRARSLRNVCSNLDDSDEDCKSHMQVRDTVVDTKLAGTNSQNLQAIGIHASTHTPPRNPYRKRARARFVVEAFPPSQTSNAPRSVTAVRPDGSLSSPVVARLLKRTRELVEEFDVTFATLNSTVREKKAQNSNKEGVDNVQSPCMTLTMNVTCTDNGSGGLDLSQDVRAENCNVINTQMIAAEHDLHAGVSSKRKTKTLRNPDGITKIAVGYERSSFEFVPADKLPSTPQRTQKSKTLLQTPMKDEYSPGFYRSSPSLNLTPTKTTPSTALLLNRSAGLLRTPIKSDHSPTPNQSPVLMSPHRRKAKTALAPPSARSSSIFDFTA